jgi:hypothetical protein
MMYELVGGDRGDGQFCVTSGERVLCLIRCALIREILRDKSFLDGRI